jgi:hypothetical protein
MKDGERKCHINQRNKLGNAGVWKGLDLSPLTLLCKMVGGSKIKSGRWRCMWEIRRRHSDRAR